MSCARIWALARSWQKSINPFMSFGEALYFESLKWGQTTIGVSATKRKATIRVVRVAGGKAGLKTGGAFSEEAKGV
eukprot:scaffold21510_cov111-Isochrysis_galbana.AAC.8